MLLYRVSKEAKLELEEDEYVERFKPFMMDIVYEWTKGASFLEICKMTDMFEVFFLFFLLLQEHSYTVLSSWDENIHRKNE